MTRAFLWSIATTGAFAMALLATPADAFAGDLKSQIENRSDGVVQIQFKARRGVYGDGDNTMITRDPQHWTVDRSCCEGYRNGPVFVELRVRRHEVVSAEVRVGGVDGTRSDKVTDLGEVAPDAAADYLLDLAAYAREDVGVEAISAANFADGVIAWPRLLKLARDRKLSVEVRKKALFWVGEAAGDSIGDQLDGVTRDDDEDVEVRKAAVFALSQRPHDESVRTLLRIARSKIHPEVRRSAFFWLAQYDDPEVAGFFEEILVGK